MDSLGKVFGTPARLKLLRLFFFNDDLAFTIKDSAFRTRITESAARKEIALLLSAGVIRKKAGKRAQYQADPKFPHFTALQAFLRDSTEISDAKIITKLKKSGTLRQITLSGVFTGAVEPKIDIIVVGDRLDDRALTIAVRSLEAELGRELRYASFTAQDFRYRVGVYDRLVRDVFDYPHRTIFEKSQLS